MSAMRSSSPVQVASELESVRRFFFRRDFGFRREQLRNSFVHQPRTPETKKTFVEDRCVRARTSQDETITCDFPL